MSPLLGAGKEEIAFYSTLLNMRQMPRCILGPHTWTLALLLPLNAPPEWLPETLTRTLNASHVCLLFFHILSFQ